MPPTPGGTCHLCTEKEGCRTAVEQRQLEAQQIKSLDDLRHDVTLPPLPRVGDDGHSGPGAAAMDDDDR
jgi:hypothetical protein